MRTTADQPWYRRARRWGQLNLSEADPRDLDLEWARRYLRETRVDGVILNAGGIVAFYPSRIAHHYRAAHLGERDLFGELVALARAEGLAVLARMDSNRALAGLCAEHPDWFVRHGDAPPEPGHERYVACVNGGYYREFLPAVMREIIERYAPDGFTDNSWTGLGAQHICRCPSCRNGFAEAVGGGLPRAPDWTDPVYRAWYRWSMDCRTALWRFNQAFCREVGGEHCFWMGMIHANPVRGHVAFADLHELLRGQPAVMCDHQSRDVANGFEQNATNGMLLRQLAGREALIPESMACYVRSGGRTFRQTAAAPEEARAWMRSGIAGGLAPWWHHVGPSQGDARQFAIPGPVFDWHAEHEDALVDRDAVADLALVWSQDHIHFGGRDEVLERVEHPWCGWTGALVRARLPWLPLHARDVDANAPGLLILPDLAAMRDDELAAVRAHVERGGSLIASGLSGRWDADGEPRADWPLAELLGVRGTGTSYGIGGTYDLDWEHHQRHNYLKCSGGPHPILAPFAGTDRLGLGGTVQGVEPVGDARGLMHYIPAYPLYPPEFAWPREERPEVPGIVVREHPAGGRLVYLAADVDRAYGRSALPDHGDLLAACVRWALGRAPTVQVDGPGRVDVRSYRQRHAGGERLLVHLVNHSHSNGDRCREDTLAVGPLRLTTSLSPTGSARCLVTGAEYPIAEHAGAWSVDIPRVEEHALIELRLS